MFSFFYLLDYLYCLIIPHFSAKARTNILQIQDLELLGQYATKHGSCSCKKRGQAFFEEFLWTVQDLYCNFFSAKIFPCIIIFNNENFVQFIGLRHSDAVSSVDVRTCSLKKGIYNYSIFQTV